MPGVLTWYEVATEKVGNPELGQLSDKAGDKSCPERQPKDLG